MSDQNPLVRIQVLLNLEKEYRQDGFLIQADALRDIRLQLKAKLDREQKSGRPTPAPGQKVWTFHFLPGSHRPGERIPEVKFIEMEFVTAVTGIYHPHVEKWVLLQTLSQRRYHVTKDPSNVFLSEREAKDGFARTAASYIKKLVALVE